MPGNIHIVAASSVQGAARRPSPAVLPHGRRRVGVRFLQYRGSSPVRCGYLPDTASGEQDSEKSNPAHGEGISWSPDDARCVMLGSWDGSPVYPCVDMELRNILCARRKAGTHWLAV